MGADDSFTIDELADAVGMTPRNVRAYRTKGLLSPPVREGRASSYRTAHLRRLRDIKDLRQSGLPLKMIIEAAQRGDDLSARGPLSLLTATFAERGSSGSSGSEDDAPDEPGSPAPAGAVGELLQRLSGHGLSRSTVLVVLLRSSRAGRALASELSELICTDLMVTQPHLVPRPILEDTVELAVTTTQDMLDRILLS